MTGYRHWQWQELAWDSPISPAPATTALERLTTATELGPLVLELRADDLVSVVRDLQDSGNSRKERR